MSLIIIRFAHMKRHLTLYLLLGIILSWGCKDHSDVSDLLDRADSLMETAPDTAYVLLQSIDAEELVSKSHRAHYALLYTQAQDKNYIDEVNDSLIDIAVDYYCGQDDVRRRFLSLYYKGRVYVNAGDNLNAMLPFSKAELLVSALHDDYYAGLLYSQLGDIYLDYYDFPKGLESFQMAEACYRRAGKDLHLLYAILDCSTAYRNLDEYEKSDSLLQFVLKEAESGGNHSLQKLVMGNMVMQYVEQERMDEAKTVYEELNERFGIDGKNSSFMADAIQIFLHSGLTDEAEQLLQKAWECAEDVNDSISCHFAASEIYRSKQNYEEALQEHTSGILLQNKIVIESLEQPVMTIQRNYLLRELEHRAYKRKVTRIFIALILGLVVIILVVLGHLSQKWIRKHYRQKMDSLWEEAMQREETIFRHLEELKQEMEQKEELSHQSILRLQEELNLHEESFRQYKKQSDYFTSKLKEDNEKYKERHFQLCRNYFKTLDTFFDTYNYEYVSEKVRNAAIESVLMRYAEKYTKGEKEYALLEKTINEQMDKIMIYLREEVVLPGEEYYRQACLLFAGFSGNTISRLMDTTPNAIYKRRLKIITIIESACPIHAAQFLKLLNKE